MRRSCSFGLGALLLLACSGGCSPPTGTAAGDDSGAGGSPPDGSSPDASVASDGSVAPDGSVPTVDGSAPAVDSSAPPLPPFDAGPTVPGTIAVDPSTVVGTIPPSFLGLSYEKGQLTQGFFRGDNAPLIALFKLLGPGLLRVGGNSVDRTEWQSYDGGAPAGDAAAPAIITAADVDALSAFASAAGWKVLYGVNMKTSFPAVAADEASYAATSLGATLYGFEIGNEVDLYKATSVSKTWSYATFTTWWPQFATAMRGQVASATFTGPASAAHYDTWTVPFAKDEGSQIELLTQHYYRGNGQAPTSTLDALLTPDPNLPAVLDALDTAAKGATISGGYRLSECNSYYNGGAPNVSDAFGTALWVIDFLAQNAEHGSAGVNLHGGGNGPGYTPIADTQGAVVGARPEYYGVLLFSMAGQGSLYKTTVTVPNLNVSAYAVNASDGSTNVLVVSKDAASGIHATIDLGTSVASASATFLLGPSLDATSGATLGGAPISPSGTFTPYAAEPLAVSGTKVTVDVPAASAALVRTK